MQENEQEDLALPAERGTSPNKPPTQDVKDIRYTTSQGDSPPEEPGQDLTLHGLQLCVLLAFLYLSVYLLALELTMLSTVIPTLTDEFGTVADISWYESAYVLPLCVLTPVVAKLYDQFRIKHVYLAFMAIFELGLVICAIAKSSHVFIVGRAINGLGAAGQFNGCMLIMSCVCDASVRPLSTALAMSMIPIGSMTGPIIAGALTARMSWRWSFWILLPKGGAVIFVMAIVKIAEQSEKPPFRTAIKKLPKKIDPVGFVLFAAAVVMLLLPLTWGGGREFPWVSATMLGLLCGGFLTMLVFCWWVWFKGEVALIPASSLSSRSVYVGSIVIFFQGGASQAVPFFLPLWFQAIKGDGPSESAVHLLPSLATMIVGLVLFGSLVRKTRYIPPWAILGSVVASVGSGLCNTLTPSSSVGVWVGFQVITSIGRGMALQAPITAVQELLPVQRHAVSLSVLNLFLQLGTAVSVSACQTILNNRLPVLLYQYVPGVNATRILEAGATSARSLVEPAQMDGFLKGYNEAVTAIFYFPTAACVVAVFASCALEWKAIGGKKENPEG